MRRVLCLYLPRWPIERRQAQLPADRPLALVQSAGSRRLVSATNPAAEAQGILPGLPLADARAQLPRLAIADADPEGDAAALLRLAQWCGRYSPWTVPHGPEGILLDITGCAHLAGGEDRLAGELARRLLERGFTARIGIADTIGGAWAVAWAGAQPVAIVTPGETRAALAPLPVRALRLDRVMLEALERLGLNRIGDLYPIPRADLASRFGDGLMARFDEALGKGREAMSPLPPAAPFWFRRCFTEPIATGEDIAAATRLLLDEACERLGRESLGVRLVTLAAYRVDGEVASLAVGTARPSRDAAHLMRLFAERLETIDPGLGIEDMLLVAKTVEDLAPAQLEIPLAAKGEIVGGDVSMLIDRLANRLGPRAVGRLLPHDSHLPERAQRFLFAFAPAPAAVAAETRPRPVRLLSPPEPIEAVAPVPDDPPMMFRWRRRLHHIARAEGPERIMGEWWRGEREAALLRDYYRVEDKDGRRYWVFRAGLYRPEAKARWFLHGFHA